MDLTYFRSLFPHIANGFVHLNHAGISPVSTPVVDAITSHIKFHSEDPVAAIMSGFETHIGLHDKLARLLGVPAQDVAVTKNTAHGVSIVAEALDWRAGDEVVFADCEYPANTYPWLALQDRGVVPRIVKTPPDGRVLPDLYADAMTARTRVLAVSWVQFSTGYRSDLAALAHIAHDRGSLLFVDVIQALGAIPIDLDAIGVDMAATGSQKWLIGPLGVGGLYIAPHALERLRVLNVGAGSAKNVIAFDPLGFDLKENAQRYEEGTPNLLGSIGLDAAISLLESAGIESIAERVLSITGYAIEELTKKGYQVVTPTAENERAGILLFTHPTIPNERILGALAQAKVNNVSRGGRMRFAPHFYNNEEDIDRALAALPS